MDYIKYIAELIKIDGIDEDYASLITVPKDLSLGDYCLPCFKFSKVLRQSPQIIAENIAKSIDVNSDKYVKSVQAVAGYVNFMIDKSGFAESAIERAVREKDNYGHANIGNGRAVCIDYSSINIAKPFHIGHLSTTVIGAALYRIYNALGYKAIGINHLGDWGTQFGKLIVAYKLWGDRDTVNKGSINELLKLYVKFHEEAKAKPELDDEARAWFLKIERGDKEALELFEWFKELTLKEVGKVYERLNIKFDSYAGESFYNDKMQPILDRLDKQGLLSVSDGAKVVNLDKYDMPPCLLVKADGATLYATRDIAAAFYRKATYDFYKCLYVVAYQQNLHFKQWFKVVELMGEKWAADLVHVAFGMVSLEDGTLSTREGRVVFLSDVLDKSVEKAKSIIEEKNPDIDDKDEIAEKVGVGAVVFSALSSGRIKDITFSYDKVLNFDGETAPYLQYTYARCRSVLRKAENTDTSCADYNAVVSDEGNELVKLIEKFPQVIVAAAEKYEPSMITHHLIDVAQSLNKYYFNNRILGEASEVTAARLKLIEATSIVLRNGLTLLGIGCPEHM